jgi:hypothetical protein
MQRASIFALCSLLFAGCATTGSKPTTVGDTPVATPSVTVPAPTQVVGRIISVDMRELAVVIEVPPFEMLPPDYSGRVLVSRLDDLRPTARMQASPYLRGRTLAARLLAGRPQVGDEVVFAPTAP